MNVTAGRPPVRALVLIGTRPEAIKMLPVVLALRESARFEPVVVTTGQHRDLVDPILELGAIEPDIDLGVGRGTRLRALQLLGLAGGGVRRGTAAVRSRQLGEDLARGDFRPRRLRCRCLT